MSWRRSSKTGIVYVGEVAASGRAVHPMAMLVGAEPIPVAGFVCSPISPLVRQLRPHGRHISVHRIPPGNMLPRLEVKSVKTISQCGVEPIPIPDVVGDMVARPVILEINCVPTIVLDAIRVEAWIGISKA